MKNREKKEWYLYKGIIPHIILLVSCVAVGVTWAFINNYQKDTIQLIGTCLIIFFDMEVVRLVLIWFKKLNMKFGYRVMETSSVKRIIWINLLGLLFFYVLFIAINTIGVMLWVILLHMIKGWDLPNLAEVVIDGQVIKVTAIAMLLSSPIFLIQKWIQAVKNEFKLKEQNLIFQNETLKNQVNPHFLFNSLNTLSSLVNTEVETAGQFIGKLSVIYRYILDNGSKLKVSLKEEVDFIRDYFYLHQIRNEGKIFLNVEISEKDYSFSILPVSLQLLIENAIKHNMATHNKPLIINIYIEGRNIVVKNNIQKMATRVLSTNIGLKNLSERAKLVTGNEIKISETESEFLVKVPLLT
ncbi:MAG: histidine kinase [Prolixibacteraceae bacterium]|nr:histidine kinase [Prolixibacteraceae bacterium]